MSTLWHAGLKGELVDGRAGSGGVTWWWGRTCGGFGISQFEWQAQFFCDSFRSCSCCFWFGCCCTSPSDSSGSPRWSSTEHPWWSEFGCTWSCFAGPVSAGKEPAGVEILRGLERTSVPTGRWIWLDFTLVWTEGHTPQYFGQTGLNFGAWPFVELHPWPKEGLVFLAEADRHRMVLRELVWFTGGNEGRKSYFHHSGRF